MCLHAERECWVMVLQNPLNVVNCDYERLSERIAHTSVAPNEVCGATQLTRGKLRIRATDAAETKHVYFWRLETCESYLSLVVLFLKTIYYYNELCQRIKVKLTTRVQSNRTRRRKTHTAIHNSESEIDSALTDSASEFLLFLTSLATLSSLLPLLLSVCFRILLFFLPSSFSLCFLNSSSVLFFFFLFFSESRHCFHHRAGLPASDCANALFMR